MRERLMLDQRATSAGQARHFAADVLKKWGISGHDVAESVILLVSELVTNAVIHAHSPVELVITHLCRVPVGAGSMASPDLDGVVRVEVRDRSALLPQLRHVRPTATHGRGLALVESLSDRWGVDTAGYGKHVWFEVRAQSSARKKTPSWTLR